MHVQLWKALHSSLEWCGERNFLVFNLSCIVGCLLLLSIVQCHHVDVRRLWRLPEKGDRLGKTYSYSRLMIGDQETTAFVIGLGMEFSCTSSSIGGSGCRVREVFGGYGDKVIVELVGCC